jgi:hypothetical protein
MSDEIASVAPTSAPTETAPSNTPPVSKAAPVDKAPTEKAPVAAKPTEAETALQKLKVKIDGEEREVSYEQVQKDLREYQKHMAAQKRFEMAAQKEREAKEFWSTLEKDPLAALESRGISIESKFAEKLLAQSQQWEMTPEQKAIAERDAKIAAYEAKEKERTELETRTQREAKEEAMFKGFQEAIFKAVEGSGLPEDPHTFAHLSEVANEFLEYGLPLKPAHLIQEVKERQQKASEGLAKRVSSGLKGDSLLSFLGPITVEEVLRASVAKVQGANPFAKPPPPEPSEPPGDRYMTPDEYEKWSRARS